MNPHKLSALSASLLSMCLLCLIAGHMEAHRRPPMFPLDECDTLFALTIKTEGQSVRLSWYDFPGVDEWVVLRATTWDMSDMTIVAVVADTNTWLESPQFVAQHGRAYYRVVARWTGGTPENFALIESFDDSVELQSYEGQDQQPTLWRLTRDGAYNPYAHCLEIYGNTWKRQAIAPVPVGAGTIWRLAVKAVRIAENQSFGVADSANELWYGLWGRELRNSEAWNNTYQGWYGDSAWVLVDLPVGDDWMGRFGYYPRVTGLLYANDNDTLDPPGILRVDEIRDVTGTLSLPPHTRFRWRITARPHPDTVEVTFCSMGCDPEGPLYRHLWCFGDGSISFEAHPVHRYRAGRAYKVALMVRDTSNRVDWAVQQIADTPFTATRRFTILFTGDVMLARRYELDVGNVPGIIPTRGVNAIFERVQPLISSVDFAMCNLECPLTNYNQRHPTKEYCFKGRPEYVGGLVFAGFDFASTANNHTFDYLTPGMLETMQVLDSVGILNAGSGENDEIARAPVFLTQNGLCVGVLAFCNRDGTADNEQPYLMAGPGRPGFALWDRANMEVAIRAVRPHVDLLIVQVHSGIEYATTPPAFCHAPEDLRDEDEMVFSLLPDTSDRALRLYALELGADLVVNHHPHVIQGLEVRNGKVIAHSMGNFAFDQRLIETFPSMVVTATASAHGIKDFVVHPIFIDRYYPTPATGELGVAILDYIADLSRPLGTWVVRLPGADTSFVVMDTLRMARSGTDYTDTLALETRGGYAMSAPYLLQGDGYPVRLNATLPAAAEWRLGREILWFGNMEDEGATQWDLNSNYERYDTVVAYRGRRSIGQNRSGGGTNSVSTTLLFRQYYNSNVSYSLMGWIRGQNTREAKITAEYYDGRGILRGSTDLCNRDGTFNWTRYWSDLQSVAQASYLDIRVGMRAPTSGTGYTWYDDIVLVRWDDWQTGAREIAFPGCRRYVQVRAPQGATAAVISYRMEYVTPLELASPEDNPISHPHATSYPSISRQDSGD